MTDVVTVQFYKYPRRPHWHHTTRRLGTDDHGIWLWSDAGSLAQRGDEPPVTVAQPFLHLIPPTAHWSAIFNGPDAPTHQLYVDVCTPAQWVADDRVEMIDLDLDVVRSPEGEIRLLDEDEFRTHSVTWSYPASMVAAARTTAAELVLGLERDVEPFSSAWIAWWERASTR